MLRESTGRVGVTRDFCDIAVEVLVLEPLPPAAYWRPVLRRLTRGEQTLVDAGEAAAVLELRRALPTRHASDLSREIEELTRPRPLVA